VERWPQGGMNQEAFPDALPARYRLHWYVMERVLGQGGFGITYLARDSNLDVQVAIKEYLPSEVAQRRSDACLRPRTQALAERYRWGLGRFIEEARTLARFDHPNIVRVQSVFEANDTAYMVMRFEQGENLATLLDRRGTLAQDELLRILLPIIDGLERVHLAGFIHRDIKPENIHIRSDGSPVLLDFGSARQALGRGQAITVLVAPGYAPLEQYYGESDTQGPWTDIYGLAATAYRAIAGVPPQDAVMRAKGRLGNMTDTMASAASLGAGRFDHALLSAIDHGLQLTEASRPQSLGEWRRELVGATGGARSAGNEGAPAQDAPTRSSVDAPVRAFAPAGAAPNESPVATPAPAKPATTARRSQRPVGAAGAVVVAALLGGGLWSMLPRNRTAVSDAPASLPAAASQQMAAAEVRTAEKPAAPAAVNVPSTSEAAEAAAASAPPPPVTPVARTPSEKLAVKREPALPRRQPASDRAAEQPAKARRAPDASNDGTVVVQPPPVGDTSPGPATLAKAPAEAAVPAPPPSQAAVPARRDAAAEAEEAFRRGDYAIAERLARPGAKRGVARAQELLGRLAEEGRGATPNAMQAYIWYKLAAQNGLTSAQVAMERVAKRLQPAEIAQADHSVRGWTPESAP